MKKARRGEDENREKMRASSYGKNIFGRGETKKRENRVVSGGVRENTPNNYLEEGMDNE